MKSKKYEVISFDMFQTLVDVNQRIPEIWEGALKEYYTEEKGIRGAKAVLDHLSEAYQKSIHPFRDMETMFLESATNAIQEIGLDVLPEKLVYHLMYQHSFAPFYEETLSTISRLEKEYMVVISSDASHLMIDRLLIKFKMERVFISDDLGCYKGEASGRFFNKVLQQLNVSPDNVLHIGDSSADIIGAHAVGIDSCWINREYREWNHSIKPNYVIHKLDELFDLI